MMLLHSVLVADAILMLYAGYRDLKEFSVSSHVFVATLASFVTVAGVTALTVSLLPVVISLVLLLVALALVHKGLLGLGDLSVYQRYPLIVSMLAVMERVEIAVAKTLLLCAFVLVYYYVAIRPMICQPQFLGVAYVKREHFMKPNVIPIGVKVEADDAIIDEVKKKLLMEKKDVCLKARVGYPLIGLYSLSYSLAVALILLFC